MEVYKILSSGSDGNAILYFNRQLLVDVGVSYKAIAEYINDIKYVFISHEHSDHFDKKTILRLSKENPLIKFLIGEHLLEKMLKSGVDKDKIVIIKNGEKYKLGKELIISPIKLYHNVENMGLRVFYNKEIKLFHATDTYTLDGIKAKDYDYYMVERNFDEDILREKVLKAEMEGAYSHGQLSKENHLSKQRLEEWLSLNIIDWSKSKVVYLHESSTYL